MPIGAPATDTEIAQKAVYGYLRVVRDRASASVSAELEAGFIRHAAAWAAARGADGATLAEFGVSQAVLARAGLPPLSSEARVREGYALGSFTVRQLAMRVGLSQSLVRRVVLGDIRDGALVAASTTAGTPGRPAQMLMSAVAAQGR